MTSRTGLCASPVKKVIREGKVECVQLRAFARRAPFILKPFAGLYNPYPYGCSLLCNHPTDNESKEILKKAKDNWQTEGKNVLLAEEIDAIRAGLEQLHTVQIPTTAVESVPEELFRRYTDTDSRPLTPAPTLSSGATRASGCRRCLTPDPLLTNQIHEKTLLILDLRRSHSQETLSYHGSSSLHPEPPIIRIQRVATRPGSYEDTPLRSPTPQPKIAPKKIVKDAVEVQKVEDNLEEVDDEEVKRRGKRRKKKRDASRGPPAFQASLDPETQVTTLGLESHNPSARPSLIPTLSCEGSLQIITVKQDVEVENESFLNQQILKQLRRELNEEIVENEFNNKRRKALEEALKVPKTDCSALLDLQKELHLAPINTDLWLSLPRVFSRSSARFELPLDSRTLETMTVLDYVRDHVSINSARKLLYNCIFNQFRNEEKRLIEGKEMGGALDLMMGRPMTLEQKQRIRALIGWGDDSYIDFKTFCGVSALCERILAPEYYQKLPNRKEDPCHEIETADFQALSRKLHGKNVGVELLDVLTGIKNF